MGGSELTGLFSVRKLSKHYGAVQCLDSVSLDIAKGECFGLLGPNGAGKTTLLEIMMGLIPPSTGDISYDGGKLLPRLREEAGSLFQSTSFNGTFKVREIIALFLRLYHIKILPDFLAQYHLEKLYDRPYGALSGGEKQRVLIACALLHNPQVIFLDEPTTGLDPRARAEIWACLQKEKARGTTIILSTHYMEEAMMLCDRLAILRQGKVMTIGAPAELIYHTFKRKRVAIAHAAIAGINVERLPLYQIVGEEIFIDCEDPTQVIQKLLDCGISLKTLRVLDPTLEDLYMHYTGMVLCNTF